MVDTDYDIKYTIINEMQHLYMGKTSTENIY